MLQTTLMNDTSDESTDDNSRNDRILRQYVECYEDEKRRLKALSSRWKSVAFLRGGMFLLAFVPLLLAAKMFGGVAIPWLVLSGILFLSFLAVAVYHEMMSRQIRVSRLMSKMHEESILRLKRDLSSVFMPPYEIPETVEAIATDLDLFGEQSLFQLLATPRTPFGAKTLGNWISYGANIEEVDARQIAVSELKNQQSWRQDFRLRCAQLAASQSGPGRFVEWAESENWVDSRKPLLWLCRIIALASLGSIVLLLFGVLPLTIVGPTLMVTITLNFFVSVFFAGAMHDIFNQISSHQDEISHYDKLFNDVVSFKSKSPFLQRIRFELAEGENDVRKQIKSLGTWNWLANIRRNGIFFIGYLIFEFLFMWDIHILERLERWKDRTGKLARQWFEALGRWEAILALSKLAHDHPDWNFPELVPGKELPDGPTVECEGLGHPLMDGSRVTNDVSVGPPGTVLLVSGSNMSGKSTLLRSLGVNSILAQMGSVVCADKMKMSPVKIETSMRIVDSLASGTSFFMAELKRLKEIVDQACEFQSDDAATLIFLLDEILQGTNSRERQIAVSKVVESLIGYDAIGAISTHDLELAATKELKDACVPVHFSEKFVEIDGKKQMTFDYRMKRGIAETTNALKLLELVGLAESDTN